MNISVRQLKNSLTQYLRRAEKGEEITVTSRGRRIARIIAVSESPTEEKLETDAVAQLDTQPWILPPTHQGKLKGSDHPLPWQPGQKTAEELTRDIRD
jgi:prevent-host-death family protein